MGSGGIYLSENSLQSRLQELGLEVVPAFNKGYIRKGAQWFIGRELNIGGILVQIARFGDFKKDVREEWKSEACAEFRGEDKKKLQETVDKILNEERAAQKAMWEEVAKEAEELWANATDRGTHPYLEQKKLSKLHGARIHLNESGHPVLLVPMRDREGKLWNITRIYTKKFEGTGTNKFVLKGGLKVGVFHTLGEIREQSTVYLAEGFATGASIFEALSNQPVVVCFDAGNLKPVALALRESYPDAKFIFCADDDRHTKRSNGQLWNPGKEKALEAASLVNGTVLLPRFRAEHL